MKTVGPIYGFIPCDLHADIQVLGHRTADPVKVHAEVGHFQGMSDLFTHHHNTLVE